MNLAEKSLRAVKSDYVGTVIRVGAQLGAQILIMRELGPEMVGVFGYALLLYGVLALAIDQGFGWSLIQGDFNDKEEIATVFSRIMLASFIAMIGVFAFSYQLEHYLGSELVGTVFRYCAPSYLFIGLFVVAQAKLRAELRFREIQTAVTGSYLLAYPVVGVTMALSGFGVWSLLAAWYVQGILQVAIAYYHSPHSFRLANPFRPSKTGPLGRHVAGINIVNWAVDNSSGVFVGAQGAAALGNFNAASMLARTPAMQMVQTLQTILFSTASAVAGDLVRIKRLYLGALATIGFIVLPAYGFAATHSDLIVGLVFGDKWQDATGIFAVLSVGMVAMAVGTLSSSILTATGGQQPVLISQLVCLTLMVTGLYFAAGSSLIHVGIAMSAAYLVRLAMQMKAISQRVGIGAFEIVSVVKGPVCIAALMAFPIPLAGFVDLSPYLVEAAGLAAKTLIAILLVIALPRFFLSTPFQDVLGRFAVGRKLCSALGL